MKCQTFTGIIFAKETHFCMTFGQAADWLTYMCGL